MEIKKYFNNYNDFMNYIRENKIARCERQTDRATGQIVLIYNK